MKIISKIKEKYIIAFFLATTIAVFFVFGFQHLTKFVTADEHYWVYERVPQYWKSISDRNFKKTLINDKPGVTVALISGAGLLNEKNPETHKTKIDNNLDIYNFNKTEKLYATFRLPILIFSGLFLIYFFWIIKKICNKWIALWSVFFIGMSPILLGISQIINPDSLLWIFSSATIFSYLALLKYNQKKYLFFTSIFLGFAILSKYSANIFFPFFVFLFLLKFLFDDKKTNFLEIKNYFKKQIFNFFVIVIGSLATVSLFLPAVFIKPIYLYRLTLEFSLMKIIFSSILLIFLCILLDIYFLRGKILVIFKNFLMKKLFLVKSSIFFILIVFITLIIGRNFPSDLKVFNYIPFDIKEIGYSHNFNYFPNLFEKLLIEFNPLVFSLTPIVLFVVISVLFGIIFLKIKFKYIFYLFSLIIFILIYYLASIFSDVAVTVRYSIILYPIAGLIAAIGIWEFWDMFFKKKFPKSLIMITIFIFTISIFSLYSSKPFYFCYSNFILPKNRIISDAWGYGGYEAAQHLNSLSDAEKLTIWADYHGVCDFFVGKCITDNRFDKEKYKIDYYVLTRRGRIKHTPYYNSRVGKYPDFSQAFKYYDRTDPFWELYINDRPQNYVRIFKAIE